MDGIFSLLNPGVPAVLHFNSHFNGDASTDEQSVEKNVCVTDVNHLLRTRSKEVMDFTEELCFGLFWGSFSSNPTLNDSLCVGLLTRQSCEGRSWQRAQDARPSYRSSALLI